MSRAELAWLDGMLAVARRDTNELRAARDRLRIADTVSTALLDRTLGAFERVNSWGNACSQPAPSQ